jgi:hypothetical protein
VFRSRKALNGHWEDQSETPYTVGRLARKIRNWSDLVKISPALHELSLRLDWSAFQNLLCMSEPQKTAKQILGAAEVVAQVIQGKARRETLRKQIFCCLDYPVRDGRYKGNLLSRFLIPHRFSIKAFNLANWVSQSLIGELNDLRRLQLPDKPRGFYRSLSFSLVRDYKSLLSYLQHYDIKEGIPPALPRYHNIVHCVSRLLLARDKQRLIKLGNRVPVAKPGPLRNAKRQKL